METGVVILYTEMFRRKTIEVTSGVIWQMNKKIESYCIRSASLVILFNDTGLTKNICNELVMILILNAYAIVNRGMAVISTLMFCFRYKILLIIEMT